MNLNDTSQSDFLKWKNFEKDRKMAEKCLWKSTIFINVTGCSNFFKVFLESYFFKFYQKVIFFKKIFADIFKNMYFLCNTIELKQSAEGTLKVQGKSLKTALDEVHFIVHLYSFPLPLVPQAKPSFSKVNHLSPPRQNKFQNSLSRHIDNSLNVYLFLKFEPQLGKSE